MNVLTISTDKTILEPGSNSGKRMAEYGSLVKELHVIVYTSREGGAKKTLNISRNVFAYPTNSTKKHGFFKDAFTIAKKILEKKSNENESDVKKKSSSKHLILHSIFGLKESAKEIMKERNSSGWLVSVQDPFETALVGSRIKKKYKIPLQIQVHTDFLSPYFRGESLKNKARVFMAKKNLGRADCLRVVSERVRQSILKAGLVGKNVPITVLPIYVPARRDSGKPILSDLAKDKNGTGLRAEYPNKNFFILIASRLTREKNISMAIRAMKKVLIKHKDALLVIVGDGPERQRIESLRKGLENNIIIKGWTNDLMEYYKSADLFLLSSNYEGYGRGVVEAQTFGLPVIMTDVGCAGDVIRDGEGAIIVPVNDENMLARRISEVIENKNFRKKLSEIAVKMNKSLTSKEKYLESQRQAWIACGHRVK